MKKLSVAMAAVLALLSIAGCAQVGKGKAPPPVVTNYAEAAADAQPLFGTSASTRGPLSQPRALT